MDFQFVTPANRSPLASSSGTNIFYDESTLDFISILREYNNRRKKEWVSEGSTPFLSTTKPVIELVFDICSVFELPREVVFLAVEIFDRFVLYHTNELWQYSCDSSGDTKSQMRYWRRISERSQKQALLRVLSSIQIASKYVLQSTALAPKHVEEYLLKWGHPYNLRSICRSECRVFSSIGYKVPTYSIYDYLFTLLELIKKWTDETEDLLSVCDLVLESTYIRRDEIYNVFMWMATGRWEHIREERIKFVEVELDHFLMASSIIVSAIYILNLKSIGPNKASEIFSEFVYVSSNDIRGLAIIISQKVVGEGLKTVSFKSCG